jgi:ssDNA-binding Zn-finger/Zn-ribbon topoisomerase 1
MIFFKSCPKCQGDMLLEKDPFGDYKHCLQCGLYEDLSTTLAGEMVGASKGKAA